jgi:YVTN family beta-propeller protein
MPRNTIHRFLQTAGVGLVLISAGLGRPATAQTAPSATGLLSSRAVALNPSTGKTYAVDSAAGVVVVYDAATGAMARVPVGPAPVSVAVNESTNRIYVANSGGDSVSVIDGRSDSVARTLEVGPRPYVVAVHPAANKVYVSNTFSSLIRVIDGRTDSITTVKAGAADAMAVDPDLDRVYLLGYEDANLTVLDGSPKIAGRVAAGMHLWGMAVNRSTHTLYATRIGRSELISLDEAWGLVKSVPVGAFPCAVAVNPVTNLVYVVNHGSDGVTVVDGARSAVLATIPVGHRPQGIAIDAQRNLVYVANVHDDSVTVIDGGRNRAIETLKTGRHPYALAVSPNGDRLYVALEASPALAVIDRPPSAANLE